MPVVPKLWYAYHLWHANALKVVREQTLILFFFTNKYIHNYSFHLLGSVNKFLNCCLLPLWFSKMTIIISHNHFVHVAFVSVPVFQTFDRIIFGILGFPGITGYVVTARHPQTVHDEEKFGNHCLPRQHYCLCAAPLTYLHIWDGCSSEAAAHALFRVTAVVTKRYDVITTRRNCCERRVQLRHAWRFVVRC